MSVRNGTVFAVPINYAQFVWKVCFLNVSFFQFYFVLGSFEYNDRQRIVKLIKSG